MGKKNRIQEKVAIKNFLKSENIQDVDSFIAVTENEKTNLIAGMLAKHLGAKQSIIHLKGLEKLGAKLDYNSKNRTYSVNSKDSLKGTSILLDEASVTGTAYISFLTKKVGCGNIHPFFIFEIEYSISCIPLIVIKFF